MLNLLNLVTHRLKSKMTSSTYYYTADIKLYRMQDSVIKFEDLMRVT